MANFRYNFNLNNIISLLFYINLYTKLVNCNIIQDENKNLNENDDNNNNRFFLYNKSFIIRSKIVAIDGAGNGSISRIVTFNEKYSHNQKRAKINYEILENKYKDGTFENYYYYDSISKLSIYYEKSVRKCYKGDLEFLYNYLFPSMMLPQMLNMIELNRSELDHIIGPARLLFLIFENWNELKKSYDKNRNEFIKNRPVITYEMFLIIKGKKILLTVYYDKLANREISYINTIPIMIHIRLEESFNNNMMTINYYTHKIIDSNMIIEDDEVELSADKINSEDKIIDQFSFPILANCPEFKSTLATSDNDDNDNNNNKDIELNFIEMISKLPLKKLKFSFLGEQLNQIDIKTEKHFVAFDGSIQSMRVDLRQENNNFSNCEYNYFFYSKSIFDFRSNRRYYLTKNNNQLDNNKYFDLLSSINKDNNNNNNNWKINDCSIVFAMSFDSFIKFKSHMNVGLLLFGSDKFNYMGLAEIRGIRSKIFEAHKTNLPYWYEQPLIYTNEKDKIVHLISRSTFSLNNQELKSLTTLVYITDDDDDDNNKQKRLLLLEVYKNDINGFKKQILRVDFYDFIWELADAPNGDKSQELFSLQNECSTSIKGDIDKFAEISLLLESKIEGREGGEKSLNDNNLLIHNPLNRNKALLSSLSESLSIQTSMISDLNSRIINNDNSLIKLQNNNYNNILASLKVFEHPNILHTIKFIGKGYIKDYQSSNLILFNEVYSAVNCLLMFSHTKISIFVMYYETGIYKTCAIDKSLLIDNKKIVGENQIQFNELSNIFKLNNDSLGQIFKISPIDDGSLIMTNKWFTTIQFKTLENKEIILKNDNSIDEILSSINEKNNDENFLTMRIRRFNIKITNKTKNIQQFGENKINNTSISNNNNSKIVVADLPQSNNLFFNGYSLPINSKLTKELQQNQFNESRNKIFNSNLMNQQNCHIACLNDLNCRSYSICFHSPEVQCILSKVDFKSFNITKQLLSNDLKKLKKGSIVSIEYNDDGETIELIRDIKCQIRNKNPLELFKNLQTIGTYIKDKSIYQVENVEQCADICFDDKNSKIIESSKLIIIELEELISNSNDNNNNKLEIIEQKLELFRNLSSSFCKSFLYIDKLNLDKDEIDELLLSIKRSGNYDNNISTRDFLEKSNGFCILPSEEYHNKTKDTNTKKNQILFQFENYKLDFTNLYQKTHGFRLKMSQFTKNELSALTNITSGKSVHRETFELLKNSINQNKNYQFRIFGEPSYCAEKCFFQSSNTWPSCKSFDVIIEHLNTSNIVNVYCLLNTISIDNISLEKSNREQNSELIEFEDKILIQYWHYEPRAGFSKEINILDSSVSLGFFRIEHNLKILNHLIRINYLGNFGIILIVIFSLISGIILGVKLGQNLNYLREKSINSTNYPDYTMNYLINR